MYYNEKWINDELCWKSRPDGDWIPFTMAQYKKKVKYLEQQLNKEVKK